MPTNAFSERLVVEIWQYCLLGRTDLLTEEGEPISVIYPGRINGDRGADLRDAVISTSQGIIRGDVEVHVKSSSWWAHRHHQDPAYNRVVLHVVYWHDTEMASNLQNGQRVPTLELHKFIQNPAALLASPACHSVRWPMPCHSAINRWDTRAMAGI